jgi:3-oxoacyl-[acyl-carrier protein] reductase
MRLDDLRETVRSALSSAKPDGDSVTVVTGGASGIGRETCLRFADEGYRVVVADHREEPREGGTPTHEIIEEQGDDALFVETDVTDWEEVSTMVETVVETFGRIDVLVNNAGIARTAPIDELSQEDWDETMAVNLDGVFHCTKAVVPVLRENGEGAIVTISSVAGKTGYATYAAYSASKFGVIGFTEAVARDLEEDGIRVNAVCPGTTRTKMTDFEGIEPEKVAETIFEVSQRNDTGEAYDVRSRF